MVVSFNTTSRSRLLRPFCCLLLLVASQASLALELRADRNTVPINETLRLEIRSGGSDSLADIDLSPIEKYFEILGRSSQSEYSMVNGRTEAMQRLSLTLKPLATGKIRIPALQFQGKRSAPIDIEISQPVQPPASASDKSVMLEAEVDKSEVYPGEQLIYTMRLMYRVGLSDAQISPLQIQDTEIVELEDISYQRKINGTQYQVVEKRYALQFKQIAQVEIQGQTLTATAGAKRGRFGFGFGVDPMRGGTPVRLAANAITLNIKAIPAGINPLNWLPAQELQLREEWQETSSQAEVGQPITRSIEVYAVGLPGEYLPEVFDAAIDGLNRYPEKPAFVTETWSGGIAGKRKDTYALIPTRPGTITLPAIKLAWWNTETDRAETATLPSRTISVKPGAASNTDSGVSTAVQAVSPKAGNQKSANMGNPLQIPNNELSTPANAMPSGNLRSWQVATLIATLGWLATAFAWWRHRAATDSPRLAPTGQDPQRALKLVQRQLLAACKAGDARQAQQLLDNWWFAMRNTLPRHTIQHKKAAQTQDKSNWLRSIGAVELCQAIDDLEQYLYAADSSKETWQNDALAAAIKSFRLPGATQQNHMLPELYPTPIKDPLASAGLTP
ncbi:MAG: protein BatD [Pseudomonadales bacterium]|nr:protein BatD [Pseudomonadales bacterium]